MLHDNLLQALDRKVLRSALDSNKVIGRAQIYTYITYVDSLVELNTKFLKNSLFWRFFLYFILIDFNVLKAGCP